MYSVTRMIYLYSRHIYQNGQHYSLKNILKTNLVNPKETKKGAMHQPDQLFSRLWFCFESTVQRDV